MSSAYSMNARKCVHAQKPYSCQAFAHESRKFGGSHIMWPACPPNIFENFFSWKHVDTQYISIENLGIPVPIAIHFYFRVCIIFFLIHCIRKYIILLTTKETKKFKFQVSFKLGKKARGMPAPLGTQLIGHEGISFQHGTTKIINWTELT